MPSNPRPNPSSGLSSQKGPVCYVATSANITYGKLYTIRKSKLCWFQTRVNGIGRLSGREDMSKTRLALNPRLRLEVFRVTVKRPSKVGQRKVRSLVRNRNYIPLESFDLPFSNGIAVKVKFPHISYLLNYLFKYLIYLQCN